MARRPVLAARVAPWAVAAAISSACGIQRPSERPLHAAATAASAPHQSSPSNELLEEPAPPEEALVDVFLPAGPDREDDGDGDGEELVLRGDWEPPNALVVAYDEEWELDLSRMIQVASEEVEVFVLARNSQLGEGRFTAWLEDTRASVLLGEHDTPWVRDYGPLQLVGREGSVVWLDFQYSDQRLNDDGVPPRLASAMRVDLESHGLWLDGGAVVSNGRGVCAITDESLSTLGIDEEDEGAVNDVAYTLGCRALAVLPALPNEETGHADMFVQFVAPDTVAVASVDSAELSEASWALDYSVRVLHRAAESLGQALTVVRVPMAVEGKVFFSYVNGVRLQQRFLVPSYASVSPAIERAALRELAAAMPWVTLVPVPADAMARRGGALHCLTMGLSLPEQSPLQARRQRRWRRPARRRPG